MELTCSRPLIRVFIAAAGPRSCPKTTRFAQRWASDQAGSSATAATASTTTVHQLAPPTTAPPVTTATR